MPNNEKILHYADAAVPRYTSYPTAADFHRLEDAPRLAALRRLSAQDRVSVYIHIPYCSAMCHYCGCFTKVTRRADSVADYTRYIVQDIKLQAACFNGRPRLAHLHWGGGTPAIISPAAFRAIMAALKEAFTFEAEAEHAIELDPRYVDAELCALLAEQGVNRASLGVQDIDAKVQQAIGRIQPLSAIERTVSALRRAGIKHINFDLIYGLPHQTEASLQETCEKTAQLVPDRIACYGYAHLPQRRANQRLIDSAILPDARARFFQAALVGKILTRLGYVPIGLDHFALPADPLAQAAKNGRLHRNFQGYTDDDAAVLLGFGASSISEFPNLYAQTIADIGQYKQAITQGRLGTARGVALNAEDKKRAALIRDLMCRFRVDLAVYGGARHYQAELARLQPLLADNIAEQSQDIITITEAGRPFVRLVAGLFDTYRQEKTGNFSPAV
ncbi:MAG: oxygen-independent coproporphyrinogen III oxidase [Candidatus Tokpelaia sp.]|nr:MAG: oxygen-independent coproporphyrinogen III oxidase [Candidatus Tokpelaia sp.]KAA6206905.1 MAG: oxygen-independent coproporphyrinogen III oxidase [Candidatus Tokpelaia sp.]